MNKPMATISTLLVVFWAVGCEFDRVSPVECIRFKSGSGPSLSEIATVLREEEPKFSTSDYRDSLTERQEDAGQEWLVLRSQSVEVSMRAHDVGFSDICVYKHEAIERDDDLARELLVVVKDFLTAQGVEFKSL